MDERASQFSRREVLEGGKRNGASVPPPATMASTISVPVKPLVVAIVALMSCTMFTTYYFCVHDGNCPALPKLPTISNTVR
jgi:hypothetical protein